MGAISFMLYNMTNPPINIDFSKSFLKMKSRGEDDTQVFTESTPILNNFTGSQMINYLSKREIMEYRQYSYHYGYHRMSVNDLTLDGSQPFENPVHYKMMRYPDLRNRPKRRLLCNGEIYNYNDIMAKYKFTDKELESKSDVEVILPLYIKYMNESDNAQDALIKCLDELDGDYSFILTENATSFDLKNINVFVVRDYLGTKPLYMVKYAPKNNENNNIFYMFVSEIKGIPIHLLNDPDYIIVEVPPGSFWSYKNSIVDKNTQEFIRYFDFEEYKNIDKCTIKKADPDTISKLYDSIRNIATDSVVKRCELSDHKVGVLLSGGFDSCILSSILVKYLVEKYNYKDPLHVFTIGDDNNSDVINAKQHVEYLEKAYNIDIHHHIIHIDHFSLVLDELNKIIYTLETFDCTTIRKSIPMAFLLKYIKTNTDIRVLLSGDGLDELCGHKELFASDDVSFQSKSVTLLQHLSKYDLLRCDKLAGSYGLEIRYPFLDSDFVKYILNIHPMLKRPQMSGISKIPVEKYIIRKAFETDDSIIIQKDILWNSRQDIHSSFEHLNTKLKNYCENLYTDIDLFNANKIFKTKEQMYYKSIFDTYYPNVSDILKDYWNVILSQ